MTDTKNSGDGELTPAEQGGTEKAPAKAKNAKVKDGKPKVGLLWFFVLITLLVSGAAGYGVYWLWQQTDQVAVSQTDLLEQSQTAIIDLRDDLGAVESALVSESSQRESAMLSAQDEIGLLAKSLEKQSRHIKELSASNRDQWLLAEVEYLLRLANQRILMSKDASGALVMLDSADGVLQGIDDVSLHNVRKAIADDLASLRGADELDVNGSYLKLAALASQVETLELYELPEFDLPEVDTELLTKDEQFAWTERLKETVSAIGSAFSKAFIIRRDNEQVEAMLEPQDELYLRQNLRLMLEQSQLALLSQQQGVYQTSLEKAQRWIAQYFLIEDKATQAALQSLSDLATLNVDPPLPDISGSFRALRKYQEDQQNARPGLDYQPEEAAPAASPEPEPVAEAEANAQEVIQSTTSSAVDAAENVVEEASSAESAEAAPAAAAEG
ncbi:MAG: uroporphyrinogen-III C-methyltransferase [Pseudomonadota bacterium]